MSKAIFERGTKPLYRVYDGERLVLKRCSKCKEYKAAGEFCADSSRKIDGRANRCDSCEKDKHATYYRAKNPGAIDRITLTPEEAAERQRGHNTAYRERLSQRTDEQVAEDRSRLRPTGVKKCSGTCQSTLPFEYFWEYRREADGLNPYCRMCDVSRQLRVNLSELLAYWEELDLWRCDYCGGPFEDIEHVIPRAQGGTDDISNLRPSCANCNRGPGGKFAMTPAQWRPDEEAALWAVVCNR